MTFEQFWSDRHPNLHIDTFYAQFAREAWDTATAAERERARLQEIREREARVRATYDG